MREKKLIPNYKIDGKLENFESFENYNRSIYAVRDGSHYSVVHWNTVILEYDVDRKDLVFFRTYHISQTTSTLVGRIIRALPKTAFDGLLEKQINRKEAVRLLRMRRVGLDYSPEIIHR